MSEVGTLRSHPGRNAALAMISAAALFLGLVLLAPSGAMGVASAGNPAIGTFELDGNATNDPAVAGQDWSNVSTPPATAFTDIIDNDGGSLSIFTGGGSKDPQPLSAWQWKNGGGLPDKDNLLHAFAARYGDVIVFGSDRFDNSGDAMQGFWLFQQKVTAESDGTFSGSHMPGDVLILSDFNNGGTVSIIAVYEWVTSGGNVSTHLNSLFPNTNSRCSTTEGDVCGIVNPDNGTPTGGWSYTDKSGNHTYLQGEFYEGGIDLSAFPSLATECFASFAAESRSSQSPTATLKDFILGDFQACQSTVTTAQTWVPNDSASVDGGGASSFTGDVAFTLYDNLTCDGNVLYSETVTGVSGTSSTTAKAATSNDGSSTDGDPGYTASATGEFSWGVTFTSKTTGVQGSSTCETSSLTVDNTP